MNSNPVHPEPSRGFSVVRLLVGWRLNMFSVHGSNEKLNPLMDHRKHRCFTFNDHFGDGETRTFECNPHMHARYFFNKTPN